MKTIFTTRALRALSLIFVMSVLTLGCDTTEVDDDPFASFAGTFDANSFVVTNADDPEDVRDLIEEGAELTLEITPEGAFTETFTDVEGDVTTRTGTLEVDDTNLSFFDEGSIDSPRIFNFVNTGTTLQLSRANERFDFDGDGVEEPASVNIELARTTT